MVAHATIVSPPAGMNSFHKTTAANGAEHEQARMMERYERHIDIPEIGIEGQKKLMASSVLVVGLGGLGCPSALYLTTSGLGRIGLVDEDTVSLSNLQRQVLYSESDVGQPKVLAAARTLRMHSSACDIVEHPVFLNEGNAADLVSSYDIVLDCTDNFDTRYLLNAACFAEKRPLISASVYHHDGQISVFRAFDGAAHPCYQCLYPKSEKLALAPQCKQGGILAPVAGIMGCMQAAAAINELLKIGDGLSGWMLMFSSLSFEPSRVRLWKREDCEVCSNYMEILKPRTHNPSGCGT
jgi:molybdopterin-synthase adenylyltransferase